MALSNWFLIQIIQPYRRSLGWELHTANLLVKWGKGVLQWSGVRGFSFPIKNIFLGLVSISVHFLFVILVVNHQIVCNEHLCAWIIDAALQLEISNFKLLHPLIIIIHPQGLFLTCLASVFGRTWLRAQDFNISYSSHLFLNPGFLFFF